jgi:hypothetical protein
MPAAKPNFRKVDLSNAIRAVIEAGLAVTRVRITTSDGARYEIITPADGSTTGGAAEPEHGAKGLDDWLPGKGAE